MATCRPPSARAETNGRRALEVESNTSWPKLILLPLASIVVLGLGVFALSRNSAQAPAPQPILDQDQREAYRSVLEEQIRKIRLEHTQLSDTRVGQIAGPLNEIQLFVQLGLVEPAGSRPYREVVRQAREDVIALLRGLVPDAQASRVSTFVFRVDRESSITGVERDLVLEQTISRSQLGRLPLDQLTPEKLRALASEFPSSL